MANLIKSAFFLISILYPFLVYWGIGQGLQRWLFILLIVLLIYRCWIAKESQERWVVITLASVVMIISWLLGFDKGLKLYPVIINLSFLTLFAFSLFTAMPIVERIARIKEPDLPANAVPYTRRVTQAWCIFFALNGFVSLMTVFANNERIWLLYNGFIAYFLIAAMMIGEWLIRRRVRGKHG